MPLDLKIIIVWMFGWGALAMVSSMILVACTCYRQRWENTMAKISLVCGAFFVSGVIAFIGEFVWHMVLFAP